MSLINEALHNLDERSGAAVDETVEMQPSAPAPRPRRTSRRWVRKTLWIALAGVIGWTLWTSNPATIMKLHGEGEAAFDGLLDETLMLVSAWRGEDELAAQQRVVETQSEITSQRGETTDSISQTAKATPAVGGSASMTPVPNQAVPSAKAPVTTPQRTGASNGTALSAPASERVAPPAEVPSNTAQVAAAPGSTTEARLVSERKMPPLQMPAGTAQVAVTAESSEVIPPAPAKTTQQVLSPGTIASTSSRLSSASKSPALQPNPASVTAYAAEQADQQPLVSEPADGATTLASPETASREANFDSGGTAEKTIAGASRRERDDALQSQRELHNQDQAISALTDSAEARVMTQVSPALPLMTKQVGRQDSQSTGSPPAPVVASEAFDRRSGQDQIKADDGLVPGNPELTGSMAANGPASVNGAMYSEASGLKTASVHFLAAAQPPAQSGSLLETAALPSAKASAPEAVSSLVSPASGSDEADRDAAQLQRLMRKAQSALEENRLTLPVGRSAYDYYNAVLRHSPGNITALRGLEQLPAQYERLIWEQVARGERERARFYLARYKNFGWTPSARLIDELKRGNAENHARQDTKPAGNVNVPEVTSRVPEPALDLVTLRKLASVNGDTFALQRLEEAAGSEVQKLPRRHRDYLLELYIKTGAREKAAELLRAGNDDTTEKRLLRAQFYYRFASLEKAIDYLAANALGDEKLIAYLAALYQKAGDFQAALDTYQGLLLEDQANGRYLLGYALAADSLGADMAAIDAYARALSNGPQGSSTERFIRQRLAALR